MLLLLTLLSLARADVVDDPPADCPAGSVGQTSHTGTWCEAATCRSDSQCAEGQTCREVALCVDTYTRECGGLRSKEETPCTFTVHEAVGECGAGGTCARGTCETALRCADPPGCGGCAGVGPVGALGWTMALVGPAVLARGRRRQR
ncbi:hypothetical protein L6R53_26065 [Myxococcota bacterium]|nr:hypothetical protein [Myxococcota bacterium]